MYVFCMASSPASYSYVPVIRGAPSPVTTWSQVSVPLISRPVIILEGAELLPPGAWPAISAATFSTIQSRVTYFRNTDYLVIFNGNNLSGHR